MAPKTTLNPLPEDPWETRLSKTVFRTIARYKDEMGLSTPELARRVSAVLGEDGELKPTTLNNMLAGKRRAITLPEVFAFANALGIPPAALVVPLGGEEQVEMFPGEHLLAGEALNVLRGDYLYAYDAEDRGGPMGTGAGWFAQQLLDAYDEVSRAESRLGHEFSVAAGRVVYPINYTPDVVQQSGLERLREAVRDYQGSRDKATANGAKLAPVAVELAWLLNVHPDEITTEAVREAWLATYGEDPDDAPTA